MSLVNLRDLALRVRALVARRRVERELQEELSFHIERETLQLVAGGLGPADARARALARFGPPALAAEGCRDARGTAFVDGVVRDVIYAGRSVRRAPLAALTIVSTVALGLGLVAVVFTIFNAFFLRVDAVRNPGELFAAERVPQAAPGESIALTRPDYEAVVRETTVFVDAAAMLRGVRTRIDGRLTDFRLVTGSFFRMVGVEAALGRTLTPADDELSAARPPVVLSHRTWRRLFGGDRAVVGRRLLVNGVPCEIVGVMPESFRGLGIGPPDYWAPLALVGHFHPYRGRERSVGIEVIGRLAPGVTPETAAAALTAWAGRRAEWQDPERGRTAIVLEPRQGTVSAEMVEGLLVFSPIFFGFGLVLMIGCANVANLLLARGLSRQREIGIRLSLGASRRRIVRQLLTESLILSLASAAGGLVVSRVILEAATRLAVITMPPEIAEQVVLVVPPADWRVLAFLASGAVAATAVFGLVPALQATRLELVRTMRGELIRDAGPGRARSLLIGVQVTASALLLICAAVFLRSAATAVSADSGLRTSDTAIVEVVTETARGAMIQAVTSEPSVAAVAASWPAALAPAREAVAEAISRETGDGVRRAAAGHRFVSAEYFQLLDIQFVKGRGFTGGERSAEAGVAVVSEAAASRLWPTRDAVGQALRLEAAPSKGDGASSDRPRPPLPRGTLTVIGVVRDVRSVFRTSPINPVCVYLPTSAQAAGTWLTVRLRGGAEPSRQALLARVALVDPALGEIVTMRMLAGMETYILRILFWVTIVLGGLALALTLSGLFGVLSYLVEQRKKEIGLRMALGATAAQVVRLVLAQSVRPVGFGLAAGAGLAAGLATVLIANASELGHLVRVFDPLAYAGSLTFIVAACALAASIPALRAARTNQMETLRQD